MIRVLLLEKIPLLAAGIRSTLGQLTDWRVQSARLDAVTIAQLLEGARFDVTILDDTTGEVRDLLELLGKQRVAALGMTLVVTAADRTEEALFQLALWGVAAYLSADMTPETFADAAQRVSAGEWMLTSEGFARPTRRHDHQQPQGAAYACVKQQEATHACAKQGPAQTCAKPGSALLSPREIDVLSLVAQGKSNKEVARTLLVSDQTIKNHLTAIYRKLVVSDRTCAVVTAIRRGLIKMPASPVPTPALYASVA